MMSAFQSPAESPRRGSESSQQPILQFLTAQMSDGAR
jgi:hypothetical protein